MAINFNIVATLLKNTRSFTSILPIRLHGLVITHRLQFTLPSHTLRSLKCWIDPICIEVL